MASGSIGNRGIFLLGVVVVTVLVTLYLLQVIDLSAPAEETKQAKSPAGVEQPPDAKSEKDLQEQESVEAEAPEEPLSPLAELKLKHRKLFSSTESGVTLTPEDLSAVTELNSLEAFLYLLVLARHERLDSSVQHHALLAAEKLFDEVVPEKGGEPHTDKLLAVVINKLPDMKGRTEMYRLRQARFFLKKSQIERLADVPLMGKSNDGAGRI